MMRYLTVVAVVLSISQNSARRLFAKRRDLPLFFEAVSPTQTFILCPPHPSPRISWSASTVGTSHESSPVVYVFSHLYRALDVLTAPHQDVVDSPSCRSFSLSVPVHHPQHEFL